MLSKIKGFPGGSEGKECAYKAGEPGSVLGLGRFPGEENGNPLQYCRRGKSHRQRSLASYSPQYLKESDMTEQLSSSSSKTKQKELIIE